MIRRSNLATAGIPEKVADNVRRDGFARVAGLGTLAFRPRGTSMLSVKPTHTVTLTAQLVMATGYVTKRAGGTLPDLEEQR